MKSSLAAICLTAAVLLGCASPDQKGFDAYNRADHATALRELKPLAEQGNARAQSNLGFMYYKGHGVILDNVYAHMWWNIAASTGNENAIKNLDIVAKRMTPANINAAQDLARECVRKKYKDC
jgi:hypothetical protein